MSNYLLLFNFSHYWFYPMRYSSRISLLICCSKIVSFWHCQPLFIGPMHLNKPNITYLLTLFIGTGPINHMSMRVSWTPRDTMHTKNHADSLHFIMFHFGGFIILPISFRINSLAPGAIWWLPQVPVKQSWKIWHNTSNESTLHDYTTTTKQGKRKHVCIFDGIYCARGIEG